MLIVQMISGTVETDRTKGSSQRRYQGYTTGAHSSDAAIGQANTSGDRSDDVLLSHVAVSSPTITGSPAAICGAIRSSCANTGSLKRNVCTYVTSEPIGMRPWSGKWLRNGT